MTLSKEQITHQNRFRTHFWIWERDLLACARDYPAWRTKAHELGFSDKTIDSTWPHPDAGRHIRYMENPYYKEIL